MKISILYICTGKYSIFWDEFYLSAQKNFLEGHTKYFFVFTDDQKLLQRKDFDVTYIKQTKLGWPFDTLYRFKLFLTVDKDLRQYDYIYFINANALIVEKVGDEIFPEPFSLIGCQHPYFYNKNPQEYIYDRNPDSLAYVVSGYGKDYVMGAFIGGESKAFLTMCQQLNNNIDSDYNKNIIALWHDESHYNKYLLSTPYKLLNPSYVYPEEMSIPFLPRILLRDKNKYGGHKQLRGIKNERFIINVLKRIFHKIEFNFLIVDDLMSKKNIYIAFIDVNHFI